MEGIMNNTLTPFGDWAKIYQDLGYWVRPVVGKAPKIKNWQLPDHEQPEGIIEKWIEQKPDHNIGLVTGSPFPDGTLLGFLDIDHDNYIGLGRTILGNPKCGRIGAKGIAYPFRYIPGLETPQKMRPKGQENAHLGHTGEILINGSLCVIPPSIHPKTKNPYAWVGTPLHKLDFNDLPLIGA